MAIFVVLYLPLTNSCLILLISNVPVNTQERNCNICPLVDTKCRKKAAHRRRAGLVLYHLKRIPGSVARRRPWVALVGATERRRQGPLGFPSASVGTAAALTLGGQQHELRLVGNTSTKPGRTTADSTKQGRRKKKIVLEAEQRNNKVNNGSEKWSAHADKPQSVGKRPST